MKHDRVINSIPLTIGSSNKGYWIVRNMEKAFIPAKSVLLMALQHLARLYTGKTKILL